jgi:ABC-type antimicrobial peptide transport system permease subunit
VGGLVASDTTVDYLERAVGRDVVLVAHEDLVEQYAAGLRRFHTTASMATMDYLNPAFALPRSLLLQLGSVPHVAGSEKRLLYETPFYEGYGVIFSPIDLGGYYYVGGGRSGSTVVMALNPSSVLSSWQIDGERLTASQDCAMIGHSLAAEMFVSPIDQEILVSEKNYPIVGICLDPFNNGNVTYVPFSRLPSSLQEFGYNLMFLEIGSENRSQALTELDNLVTGTVYRFLELNPLLDENIDFLEGHWSTVMTVPLASLVTAVFCLSTYLVFSMTTQQREFGIMRAVGVKPMMVTKIAVTQVLLLLLSSTFSGVAIGLSVTYVFLIPEPVISLSTIYSTAGLLALTIAFLGLCSLYPTLRTVKKPTRDSLHFQ